MATIVQSLLYRLITARQRLLLIILTTGAIVLFRWFGWHVTPATVAVTMVRVLVVGLEWLHDVVWDLFLTAVLLAVGTAIFRALKKAIGEVAERLADFESSVSDVGAEYDRVGVIVRNIIRRLLKVRPKNSGDHPKKK